MFRVISKWQRPSVDVAFYKRPESAQQAATDAKVEGKLISEETGISPDKLTMTYVANWDSIVSYNSFNTVPDVSSYVQARDAHNDANNIILMLKKTDVISD
jgi:hypothetical protein